MKLDGGKASRNDKIKTMTSNDDDEADFERDDDDPLSIRSLSITSLGIIFAILTIFLPSISILIGRPLSQGNEIIHNHDFKKDGP